MDAAGKHNPVLDSKGQKTFSDLYDDYAEEATEMMKNKINVDSPDPKKRSSDMCRTEQAKKRMIDELYNDESQTKTEMEKKKQIIRNDIYNSQVF